MNSNTKYTKAKYQIMEALRKATMMHGSLPQPEDLIQKQDKEAITININKKSLDAFRLYAKKNKAKYQTMINDLIEAYANTHLIK